MNPRRILAIDLGSSSLRAAVLDEEQRELASTRGRFSFRASPNSEGTFAADPIADMLHTALTEIDTAGVTDVAVSSLWHSLLGVDGDDNPVTEVFTWESSAPARAVPGLAEILDAEQYRSRTGSYLHASYPLAAFWFLRQHDRAPKRVTDLASWVLRRVLGVDIGWSRQIASGSGFWHQERQEWDELTCEAVGLDSDVIGPVWSEAVSLTSERAHSLGLGMARLHPVFGDGACNNLGVGATGPRTAAISVGTSGSIRMLLDTDVPSVPFGLWRYRLSDETTAVGGANSNVGNLFEWLHHRFAEIPLDALTADDPPDLDGLFAIPHLAGERGPSYRPDSSGALIGLRPHHTQADIHAALVLASLGTFQELGALMKLNSPELSGAVAAGGVTAAAPWFTQLLADAVALPIAVSTNRESSIVGAVTFASGQPRQQPIGPTLQPRPAWTKAISELAQRSACAERKLSVPD